MDKLVIFIFHAINFLDQVVVMLLFGLFVCFWYFELGKFHFLSFSYFKKRDAEDARDRMDGVDIDGREIRVQFARYGRAPTDHRDKSRRRRYELT